MLSTEPTRAPDTCGPSRKLAKLCLAATVCVPLASLTGEALRRAKATASGASFVVFASTSTAPVDVPAGPEVTSPTASVARFSIFPLPTIATVVDARCIRKVLVSRIGGLYGP